MHRRFLLAATLAVSLTVSANAAAAPPNLAQENPANFLSESPPAAPQIIGENGREELVFTSTVWNYGSSPFVLRGSRPDTSVATMQAFQVVDGVSRLVGAFQYNRDPTHEHWHFLNLDRYQLRTHTPANRTVAIDQKTGFCVAPYSALTGRDCERNVPTARSVSETLAPGNYDRYDPGKDGQFIDVTGLAPGYYELVQWVNSDCSIKETTYDDNAQAMVIQIMPGNSPAVQAHPEMTPYFNAWWASHGHCLPRETVRPRLGGSAVMGSRLRAAPGSWLSRLASRFSYHWRRCNAHGARCSSIKRATSSRYVLTPADVGHTLRVRVTATRGLDVEELTPQDSNATAVIARTRLRTSSSVARTIKLTTLLGPGLPYGARCSQGCSIDARLLTTGSQPVWGESKLRLRRAGSVSRRVKVKSALRSALRRASPHRILLRISFRGSGGQARTIVSRVRVVS